MHSTLDYRMGNFMATEQRISNPASDRLSDADLAEWADWEKWQNQAEWQDIVDAGRTDADPESLLDGSVEDPQWLDQMTRRGCGATASVPTIERHSASRALCSLRRRKRRSGRKRTA